MTSIRTLHKKWVKGGEYRRAQAGLTQQQLTKRMFTTQSVIARLESSRGSPSTQTLARLAAATGTKLKITFEPAEVIS